jgi:hypothetical protein
MEDINGWRKSSYSANGGECVEAADHDGLVLTRDSKLSDSPVLTFSARDWRRFTASIKNS